MNPPSRKPRRPPDGDHRPIRRRRRPPNGPALSQPTPASGGSLSSAAVLVGGLCLVVGLGLGWILFAPPDPAPPAASPPSVQQPDSTAGPGTPTPQPDPDEDAARRHLHAYMGLKLGDIAPLPIHAACDGVYLVKRVVDADTIEVTGLGRIRMQGIDCPESVHPDRPPDPFGPEASAYTKKRLTGKLVTLGFDEGSEGGRGHFGRVLAYVYERGATRSFNEELIAEGLARIYDTSFDLKERFIEVLDEARQARRGIWSLELPRSEAAYAVHNVSNTVHTMDCHLCPEADKALYVPDMQTADMRLAKRHHCVKEVPVVMPDLKLAARRLLKAARDKEYDVLFLMLSPAGRADYQGAADVEEELARLGDDPAAQDRFEQETHPRLPNKSNEQVGRMTDRLFFKYVNQAHPEWRERLAASRAGAPLVIGATGQVELLNDQGDVIGHLAFVREGNGWYVEP